LKFGTHGFERVSVLDVLRNEAGVQDGLLHLLSEAAVDGGAEVVPTRVVITGRRRQHQRRRQRRQTGGVEGHALVAHPARDVVLARRQQPRVLGGLAADQRAAGLATALGDAGDDLARQITRAYQLAYTRDPTVDEAALARQIVEHHGLSVLTRAIFNSNEFLYVD